MCGSKIYFCQQPYNSKKSLTGPFSTVRSFFALFLPFLGVLNGISTFFRGIVQK